MKRFLLAFTLLTGCSVDCNPQLQFPEAGFGCENRTVAQCDPRAKMVVMDHGVRCVCPLPAAVTPVEASDPRLWHGHPALHGELSVN